MPVKIRLMRIGAKKRPFYRVVAVDEQRKRTGGYLELLGTYNPLTQPKEIILKQDRIDDWVKKGAQYSDGFLRIIGKAPQRPPRKPKKEKKVEEAKAPSPTPVAEPEGGQKGQREEGTKVEESAAEEAVTEAGSNEPKEEEGSEAEAETEAVEEEKKEEPEKS